MKEIVNSFQPPINRAGMKRGKRKSTGQSLVEVAIALPVLLLIFSGLVEFGFMLNHYVSLTDATRETARYFANYDPFNADGTDNYDTFYLYAAGYLKGKLEPDMDLEAGTEAQSSRRIMLDPLADDIVITVFSICNGNVVARYPTAGDYRWRGNDASRFTNEEIESRLVGSAPATGVLLVEVFYDYHMVLALPWITAIIPNPVPLHSYTIMPLSAAEPSCP
ncbi:MAG: TadE/TadG family type IV pilus assembly protein [Chloroflexota bacterium]